MKRWTLRILLCLILGAVTTVAVAWGVAGLVECKPAMTYFETAAQSGRPHSQLILGTGSRGHGTLMAFTTHGLGWSVADVGDVDVKLTDVTESWPDALYASSVPDHRVRRDMSSWNQFDSYAMGWPSAALGGAIRFASRVEGLNYISEPDGILALEWRHDRRGRATWSRPVRFLPFELIWPGFVINALFYAAIWFALFFGFASAKRTIRRARGRCPRCGYDLRGGVISDQRLAMSGEGAASGERSTVIVAGCPECGWGRARDDGVMG
jgi:hypothetical protein